jgi:hypothetical protein
LHHSIEELLELLWSLNIHIMSQGHAAGPYPQQTTTIHNIPLSFFKIFFNIIFLSRFSWRFLLSEYSDILVSLKQCL